MELGDGTQGDHDARSAAMGPYPVDGEGQLDPGHILKAESERYAAFD